MLLRGVAHKKAGSFDDVRPALTSFDQVDSIIVPDYKQGGDFEVRWTTRFNEPRVNRHLHKPEAATMVKNLRSRGYKAEYSEMGMI